MNFLSNKQKVVTFNVKSHKTNNLWTKETCFDAAAAQEQNFSICQMHLRLQRANKDGTSLHPDTFCHSPAFRTKKKHYKCSSLYQRAAVGLWILQCYSFSLCLLIVQSLSHSPSLSELCTLVPVYFWYCVWGHLSTFNEPEITNRICKTF